VIGLGWGKNKKSFQLNYFILGEIIVGQKNQLISEKINCFSGSSATFGPSGLLIF
jgi:hypothetical protein